MDKEESKTLPNFPWNLFPLCVCCVVKRKEKEGAVDGVCIFHTHTKNAEDAKKGKGRFHTHPVLC